MTTAPRAAAVAPAAAAYYCHGCGTAFDRPPVEVKAPGGGRVTGRECVACGTAAIELLESAGQLADAQRFTAALRRDAAEVTEAARPRPGLPPAADLSLPPVVMGVPITRPLRDPPQGRPVRSATILMPLGGGAGDPIAQLLGSVMGLSDGSAATARLLDEIFDPNAGGPQQRPTPGAVVESLARFRHGDAAARHRALRLAGCPAAPGAAATECPVCQEDFAPGDECVVLPCGHCFHCGCLEPWLAGQSTCPTCRFALPTRRNL